MGHIWLRFFRCFNPSCGSDHGPAGTGVRGAQIRANQGGTSRVLAPRARPVRTFAGIDHCIDEQSGYDSIGLPPIYTPLPS